MAKITVRRGGESRMLEAERSESLLDALRRAGLAVNAPCGGNGKCGKCRVQAVSGTGEAEWALACRTYAERDMEIRLPTEEQGGDICGEGACSAFFGGGTGYGGAVDIGTTTVVLQLYDLRTGTALGNRRDWNAQRPYGADVVSRMQYTMENENGLFRLTGLIREQVFGMLDDLCGEAGLDPAAVHTMYVAGNTVMQHLFAGLDPRAIALAPYVPEEYFDDGKPAKLPERPGLAVYYAPCVAGYVGGDITAGILSVGVHQLPGKNLFLDVGTNGEMALSTEVDLLCCSVACGPAFEGAEISCGMSSVPGAVCRVDWVDGKPVTEVIGGGKPRGLCGSGILDLLAMLLRLGVVDDTGRLLPPDEAPEGLDAWLDEDEDGNGIFYLTEARDVYFTAGDVRKIQLAKGAVAAGISLLLKEAGIGPEEINAVYIAGGFGNAMRPASAAAIGMIPPELKNRVSTRGNTSLFGAARALCDPDSREELLAIRRSCRYLELAGNPAFTQAFMECMMFESEDE